MKSESLTERRIGTTLIRFALPFLMASALQLLYGALDLFVTRHFAETYDVSAVSAGSQIMAVISYRIIGVCTGAAVLLGQFKVAGDWKEMVRVTGTALVLFTGAAFLIMIPLLHYFCMV